MLLEKQKNIIPYELYASKKSRQPDYLCNVIKKYKYIEMVEAVISNPSYQDQVKRKLNQKRIQQIKKLRKNKKISHPQPYVKRTWISPIQDLQKKQDVIYSQWRKKNEDYSSNQEDVDKTRKICSILDLNRKMHLFGQFMYCDFDGKQNHKIYTGKIRQKKMDALHKQYSKLIGGLKKSMVICNKGSDLNNRIFVNPLKQDKYFKKIIRDKDIQLTKLLIQTLSVLSNFTFSSYILFYQIFIWQQATKQTQIEFVLKLLMGTGNQISYQSLSQNIDFMCSKINLIQNKQSLSGFNQVMKKLIFGAEYSNSQSNQIFMSRQALSYSLEINEECISIFINVFYSE